MEKMLEAISVINCDDNVTIQVFLPEKSHDSRGAKNSLRIAFLRNEELRKLETLLNLQETIGLAFLANQTRRKIRRIKRKLARKADVTPLAWGYSLLPDLGMCSEPEDPTNYGKPLPLELLRDVWLKAAQEVPVLFDFIGVSSRGNSWEEEYLLIGISGEERYLFARWGRGLKSIPID